MHVPAGRDQHDAEREPCRRLLADLSRRRYRPPEDQRRNNGGDRACYRHEKARLAQARQDESAARRRSRQEERAVRLRERDKALPDAIAKHGDEQQQQGRCAQGVLGPTGKAAERRDDRFPELPDADPEDPQGKQRDIDGFCLG